MLFFAILFFEKLFEKALTAFRGILAKALCESTKEFLLLCIHILGSFNRHRDVHISLSLGGVNDRCALALQSEGGSGLSSLGDVELLGLSANHGDVYLCTESRLCKADGNLAVYVVAISCKHRVGLNTNLDNKVACRASVSAC